VERRNDASLVTNTIAYYENSCFTDKKVYSIENYFVRNLSSNVCYHSSPVKITFIKIEWIDF
jgi:hypothetical protein